MQTRSWDAADGTKKYRTEIVAERVQFGPRRDGAGVPGAPAEATAAAKPEPVDTIEYPEEEINPDDIPF